MYSETWQKRWNSTAARRKRECLALSGHAMNLKRFDTLARRCYVNALFIVGTLGTLIWDFFGERDSTIISIRFYSSLRTDRRPSETVLADLVVAFHRSWNKSLANLEGIVCGSSAGHADAS